MAVYLDNNATTRTDPSVVQAMLPFFTEQFGNASSAHGFGRQVAGAMGQARRSVQALLGAAHQDEIVFTSGGTESNNAAIVSALATQEDRDEIVTTCVEHQAILALVEHLSKRSGVKVHLIAVDSRGRLDCEAFRSALGPRTAIASVMWANNETGTIFPVERLAGWTRACGALFHTDAVQAVGRVPIDLKASEIDMLSMSGHKLHGPKGIGALYLRTGTKFRPLIWGGAQERRRRGGTENVPGIVGLGEAAELAAERLDRERIRVAALRDRLEQSILQNGHCKVLGDHCNRLSNTANIAFEHLEGEAIVHHLNRAGIAASIGSACSAGAMEPSHVLCAMHVPASSLRGAVRFSLSHETTAEEINHVVRALSDILARLRGMSRELTNPASNL